MKRSIRCAFAGVTLALLLAGCGGGGGAKAVPRGVLPPAGPPGQGSTPPPNSNGSLSAAAVTTALQSVESFYLTLSHADPLADLNAVAAHMTSSGAFKAAVVSPGGITATLSDGTTALVFADRLEDLGNAPASLRRIAGRARQAAGPAGLGPPTAHEIAFLVNMVDQSGAFVPARQQTFHDAFVNVGFQKAGYGVDVMDASLDAIAQLGTSHPLDILDVSTHGMVAGFAPNLYYANLSTTPITSDNLIAYADDFIAGRVQYAVYLSVQRTGFVLPSFSFSPAFLTAHLHFNPGAIVDNQSCFGQSPLIADSVGATLRAAGVGRYFGWTKEVGGTDADETEAFLFDRLLGEQSPSVTGLAAYASQRTPAQRPFPLDDIQTAMAAENRNSPITIRRQPVQPYTVSNSGAAGGTNSLYPPLADGEKARLIISDFGGETVADAPIEYRLPSVARLQTQEFATGAAVEIDGTFPATPGTVSISGASGTLNPAPLSWTTTAVTVAIPVEGAGASGLVQVAVNGIASNAVPLTQWHGALTYSENDAISTFGGAGSGTLQTQFTLTIRADVHPTVVTIDQPPTPQNLAFRKVEADSSAAVTAFSGSISGTGGSATYALVPAPPAMAPFNSAASMGLGPVPSQPAPCNNGLQGPQGGTGTVFCPGLSFFSTNVGTCTGSFCRNETTESPSAAFGGVFGSAGLLELTMSPVTYGIRVFSKPRPASTGNNFGGSSVNAVTTTATVSGTFAAPLSPPSDAATAS